MPLQLPSWIHPHLFEYAYPDHVPEEIMHRIRQGLDRYSSDSPLVSLVIPAYNEEKNILNTLSSIAALKLPDHYPTELLVVNDASTDGTQGILDYLKIPSLSLSTNHRPKGARQKGLELARGTYLLQADADSIYPQGWGISYVQALKNPGIAVAYGNHAFIPGPHNNRVSMYIHELMGEIIYRFRKHSREYINVHGFNSAFRREDGLNFGSYDHTPQGSEDGHMALMLSRLGKLHFINNQDTLVWTSDRRIMADGGVWKGFVKRARREGSRIFEYAFSPQRKSP